MELVEKIGNNKDSLINLTFSQKNFHTKIEVVEGVKVEGRMNGLFLDTYETIESGFSRKLNYYLDYVQGAEMEID